MENMTFCVPCLFGLEGLVGDELKRLDLQNVRVEDRRVFFDGDFAAMAKANLCCRMGERVMILLNAFEAKSFEELFQGVKAIPLEDFIPKDGAFQVKGYSLNSQLHSVPDCQAIVKKAAVTRLGEKYGLGWLPETGATYQLRFSIMKDWGMPRSFSSRASAAKISAGLKPTGSFCFLPFMLLILLVDKIRLVGTVIG